MASLILHLAVCGLLERELDIRQPERFRLGHILPDCVPGEIKRRVNSHFIRTEKGLKIFDAVGFYERFPEEVRRDELCLGYYLHLWQDNVFRRVLYYDLGLIEHRGEPGLFRELYKDYDALNLPIARDYGVRGDLTVPEDMETLSINSIYPFEVHRTIREIQEQLGGEERGEPVTFTRQAAETFITRSVEICVNEWRAVKQGGHGLDRWALAIEDRYSPKAVRP